MSKRPSPPPSNEAVQPKQRVRLIYEKGEAIKFISHLDEFRMWERTLRRADLPLLYKRGFNPQPHMQFASPLGVGFTGAREPLDIVFSPGLPLAVLRQRITDKLPPGVCLHAIDEVPLKTPALQSQLIGADYLISIYAEPHELQPEEIRNAIESFMNRSEIWRTRERKGKVYSYNLRPLILELIYEEYRSDSEEHCIVLRVQQREGATGRPDEVVSELGFDNYARTLCRQRLYMSGTPEDAALFEQYPVVTKAQIQKDVRNGSTPRKREKQKRSDSTAQGRSISERAGDEFG